MAKNEKNGLAIFDTSLSTRPVGISKFFHNFLISCMVLQIFSLEMSCKKKSLNSGDSSNSDRRTNNSPANVVPKKEICKFKNNTINISGFQGGNTVVFTFNRQNCSSSPPPSKKDSFSLEGASPSRSNRAPATIVISMAGTGPDDRMIHQGANTVARLILAGRDAHLVDGTGGSDQITAQIRQYISSHPDINPETVNVVLHGHGIDIPRPGWVNIPAVPGTVQATDPRSRQHVIATQDSDESLVRTPSEGIVHAAVRSLTPSEDQAVPNVNFLISSCYSGGATQTRLDAPGSSITSSSGQNQPSWSSNNGQDPEFMLNRYVGLMTGQIQPSNPGQITTRDLTTIPLNEIYPRYAGPVAILNPLTNGILSATQTAQAAQDRASPDAYAQQQPVTNNQDAILWRLPSPAETSAPPSDTSPSSTINPSEKEEEFEE